MDKQQERNEWKVEHGAIGYSADMQRLEGWREKGMFCPYEHCIEMSPLRLGRDELSCPVFGHDCPGGEKQVGFCKSIGKSWEW